MLDADKPQILIFIHKPLLIKRPLKFTEFDVEDDAIQIVKALEYSILLLVLPELTKLFNVLNSLLLEHTFHIPGVKERRAV